ncbi:MAG: hypothetical protein H0X34_17895 [Chthoniobacterales bacterium]|nr:hypothetical protein [Chthoniobacterales bacterium]
MSEQLEQITVSGMPLELLKKIEQLAKLENRPRNRQVVTLLEEIVESKIEAAREAVPA